MPKVTVLLPHYKHRAYLPDAVQSIINQTFEDWELLILNDDPDVDLRGYTEIEPRVIGYLCGRHLGQTVRLNMGIREARGEYIAFQDADDISLPWRLQRSVDAMAGVDMIYGDKIILYPDGRQQYKVSPKWIPEFFHLRAMGCWGSYMVRADKICQFDEDVTYHNDHIWEARMSKITDNVRKISIPLYKQRNFTSVYKDRNGKIPVIRKIKRLRAARKIDEKVRRIVSGLE